MALKIPLCYCPRRPLMWSSPVCRFYSTSCTSPITYPPETCQNTVSVVGFESAVRSLKNRLQPDRLICVLDSTLDLNSTLRIFKWATTQRMFHHTTETYTYMISRLGLSGNSQDMEVLLREMVSLELPKLEQALDHLIHSFCQNHRLIEALEVLKHASLAKHRLSITSCNAILHVLKGSNFQSFILVYKEIVKAGTLPDVQTLNYLIKVLCDTGLLDLAIDQLRRMEKKLCTPNSQTFEIIIAALSSSGRVDESVSMLNTILELGCTLDHGFYVKVIPILCKFDKVEEVKKLLKVMKDTGHRLDSYIYAILIECLCKNHLLDDAKMLFDEMIESDCAPVTGMYVDIVDGFCEVGNLHGAMNFLDENNVLEIDPHNAMLRGFCKGDRVREAILYLEKIAERGLTDNLSWNMMITMLCEEGNVKRAFEVIARMIVSSFVPSESTYSAIVMGYCNLALYENALYVFRSASDKEMFLESCACSELIQGLCGVRRMREAAEVFYHLVGSRKSLTVKALNMLIQGTCLAGNVHEAIRMRSLAVQNGTSCMALTYIIIMNHLTDLNQEKDALPLLAQLMVEGCILDASTFCVLISSFCTMNTVWEAAVLFNKMVYDGFAPDMKTLELLVFNMANSSMLNKIVHSLAEVTNQDGLFSPRICNTVAYGLMKEGHRREACEFLDQMLGKGWVPDPQTHGLFIRNADKNDVNELGEVYDTDSDDKVINILTEGLNGYDNVIIQ